MRFPPHHVPSFPQAVTKSLFRWSTIACFSGRAIAMYSDAASTNAKCAVRRAIPTNFSEGDMSTSSTPGSGQPVP